jgi:hypothetical protein
LFFLVGEPVGDFGAEGVVRFLSLFFVMLMVKRAA